MRIGKSALILIIAMVLVAILSQNLSGQSWQYLGQTPPDSTPIRFGTPAYLANSQWFWHGTPVFSPDGTEMFFVKYLVAVHKTEIWFSSYVNGAWTTPQKASFSGGTYSDNNPRFSQHKDTLLFESGRPSSMIYRVTRSNGVWSAPRSLNLTIPAGKFLGLQFSIAKNGNIYAELDNSQGSNSDIYCWQLVNGQYQSAVKQTALCSSSLDGFPAVDANERFIMFSSNRSGGYGSFDLYMSWRNQDQSWSPPVNMGTGFNTSNDEPWSDFSPEGSYFFFTAVRQGDSGFTPYWVNAQVIYDLNPYTGGTAGVFNPGVELFQNTPNPCDTYTRIAFCMEKPGTVTLDLYNQNGTRVVNLVDNIRQIIGKHEFHLDTSQFHTGVYTYVLSTKGSLPLAKKLIIAR